MRAWPTGLNAGYQARLDLAGLPATAAAAARGSVFADLAVAGRLGSARLLESVRTAFVHGMAGLLWVSGGLAVTGVALALAFLPRHASEPSGDCGHPALALDRLAG